MGTDPEHQGAGTGRTEEKETAEEGCGCGREAGEAALVGQSCQDALVPTCVDRSHKPTVNDHVAKSQSLFPLYYIFFERASSTRRSRSGFGYRLSIPSFLTR